MSDEDTDNKQQQTETEVALDIEVVSVAVAEQEAAQARAKDELDVAQELAEQMSEVLSQVDTEVELGDQAEQTVEAPVKVVKPQQSSLQAKVEKVSEDDDVVMFDDQIDYLEEAAPVAEKTPPEASNICLLYTSPSPRD